MTFFTLFRPSRGRDKPSDGWFDRAAVRASSARCLAAWWAPGSGATSGADTEQLASAVQFQRGGL